MNRLSSKDTKFSEAVAFLITAIIISIISPFLVFWISYIIGYFVKWTIGNILIQGLMLFNINIPIEKIPLACGVLGFISSYFNTTIQNKSN